MEFYLELLGIIQLVIVGGCVLAYILGTCLVLVCTVYKLVSLSVDWVIKEQLAGNK